METQALVSKYLLIGKTITVNTLDGKAFTGKISEVESKWLTIEDGTKLFFVDHSAIASLSIDGLGQKILPQTPLRK
ncbi:MAG: hypothetical protein PHQ34_05420 [Methanothrix sp.]|nr:hypothetical protein [Methanothrix sp.]